MRTAAIAAPPRRGCRLNAFRTFDSSSAVPVTDGKTHSGNGSSVLQPGGALPATPEPQRGSQLAGHVDAPLLMVLRRRELAANEIAPDLDERAAPIDVAPLQRQQLAGAHARSEGHTAARDTNPGTARAPPASSVRHLVARERIGLRFGIIGCPQVPPETERRIRRQKFVFDRLRQDRAQRPGDPANRVTLSPFARHAVTRSRQSARRSAPPGVAKRREDVLLEIAFVERDGACLQRALRPRPAKLGVRLERVCLADGRAKFSSPRASVSRMRLRQSRGRLLDRPRTWPCGGPRGERTPTTRASRI